MYITPDHYYMCTYMYIHVSVQVKRALPLLLSSMKAFVTLKREGRKGAAEAQENRYNECSCTMYMYYNYVNRDTLGAEENILSVSQFQRL